MTKLEAPVTGRVVTIHVKAGDSVAAGDAIITVESMKMEIPIEAERAGTVSEILAKIDDEVTEGQTVATLS